MRCANGSKKKSMHSREAMPATSIQMQKWSSCAIGCPVSFLRSGGPKSPGASEVAPGLTFSFWLRILEHVADREHWTRSSTHYAIRNAGAEMRAKRLVFGQAKYDEIG